MAWSLGHTLVFVLALLLGLLLGRLWGRKPSDVPSRPAATRQPDPVPAVPPADPAPVVTTAEPAPATAEAAENEPAPVAAPAEDAAATRATTVDPATAAGPDDDLRRVSGIGPKTVVALHAADIRTFAQLADADETMLRAALRAAGARPSPSLATWPQQARALLAGEAGTPSAARVS